MLLGQRRDRWAAAGRRPAREPARRAQAAQRAQTFVNSEWMRALRAGQAFALAVANFDCFSHLPLMRNIIPYNEVIA